MKLNELLDLKDMKKTVDPKEMRKRVIKAGGNPFGDAKKKKMKEGIDIEDMKKHLKTHDPKGGKMRARIIKAQGNPFGQSKKKK